MASVQCYKTCEESCRQKSQQAQHSSFGQKVSDLFKGHHHSTSGTQTQTQCCSQTQVYSQPGYATAKTQTQCCYSQTQATHAANGTATKCHGRTRREHKKNLIQKIKDGLSGPSSDSGSSSDSDSNDENCQKRKN